MRRVNVDTAAQVAMLQAAAGRTVELRKLEASIHEPALLMAMHYSAINVLRGILTNTLQYMTVEQFEAAVNAMADKLEEETK